MQIPLYRPKDNENPFGIIPWSACIVIQSTGGPVMYYEGGLHSRPANVLPSVTEFEGYAKSATGRAIKSYPTVARINVRQSEIDSKFLKMGEVQVGDDGFKVAFD